MSKQESISQQYIRQCVVRETENIHKAFRECCGNPLRGCAECPPNPHSEAYWLHRIDMEKNAAWQQGYAQGLYRASQNTKRVPAILRKGEE